MTDVVQEAIETPHLDPDPRAELRRRSEQCKNELLAVAARWGFHIEGRSNIVQVGNDGRWLVEPVWALIPIESD